MNEALPGVIEAVQAVKYPALYAWPADGDAGFHRADPWMRFSGVFEPWAWKVW